MKSVRCWCDAQKNSSHLWPSSASNSPSIPAPSPVPSKLVLRGSPNSDHRLRGTTSPLDCPRRWCGVGRGFCQNLVGVGRKSCERPPARFPYGLLIFPPVLPRSEGDIEQNVSGGALCERTVVEFNSSGGSKFLCLHASRYDGN